MHDGGEGLPWYYKVEVIDMSLDLYSYKPFDADFVLSDLIINFEIGDWDVKVIPRRTRTG